MKYLLDTNILLWMDNPEENERLSTKTRNILSAANNKIYLSAASLWEMAIKNGNGDLVRGSTF
jgi:PIN domain nuclease of toxin-antitoxin system